MTHHMRKRRRHFSLIEMLVAVGLSAMLLTSLLGIYQLLEYQAVRQRELRSSLFTQRLLQYRLTVAFAGVQNDKGMENLVVGSEGGSSGALFFTSEGGSSVALGTSLVFITDRGPDHIPEFSNEVLTRLYRNAENQLCLAHWPLPSRWDSEEAPPMHKEVLMDGVIDLEFEFFVPPHPDRKLIDDEDVVTEGMEQVSAAYDQWHTEWDRRYKKLPAMIKVHISRKGKNGKVTRETYGYVIPASKSHIVYGG